MRNANKHSNVAFFIPHLGCPHNCSFCNQREIAGQTLPPTTDEIINTAQTALIQLEGNLLNAELAFFGGSFTAIPREYMITLLETVSPFIGEGKFKGIRISTRPDAIDTEILEILQHYNVSAIELGAQSMRDNVLMQNKRGHTSAQVIESAKLIKSAGFELGLQMMTGLYGGTIKDDIYTAEQLAILKPDTIRIYPTIVVKSTELEQLYLQGKYTPQTLEQATSLCSDMLTFFKIEEIKVIRLGLHCTESLMQSYVAGPLHPAFRELCESKIYFKKAVELLRKNKNPTVTLLVAKSSVSKLIGQHRSNIIALEEMFGVKIKVEGGDFGEELEVRSEE
jgi:histone acetyltransferase (RNA polymerase elongator complex component)